MRGRPRPFVCSNTSLHQHTAKVPVRVIPDTHSGTQALRMSLGGALQDPLDALELNDSFPIPLCNRPAKAVCAHMRWARYERPR